MSRLSEGGAQAHAHRPLQGYETSTPTQADLRRFLRFSDEDARIWLDDQSMVMLHSTALGAMRRELIESVGEDGARRILMRIGYSAGTQDAALVRKRWPGCNERSSFIAGGRLHALQGIVRVETQRLDLNIEQGHFHGEYLWHDSREAHEHVSHYGIGDQAACWMTLGYAAGYASAFIGKLVVYREVECVAAGGKVCRIVGDTADRLPDAEQAEAQRHWDPSHFIRLNSIWATDEAAAPPPAATTLGLPVQDDMVGVSAAFSVARHQIAQVAPTRATVLFSGESGVGKEVFAQCLHRLSPRARQPLVAVNCAALPESLLEAELFGAEKGAYTGATQSRTGRFERASGGTLFLDEIQALSLGAQAKLLRALQEGEIERVGGNRPIKVDLRVIAATNANLRQAIAQGTFREDLFFRLNVFPIHLPPLRERRDDIPLLMEHFLKHFTQLHGKQVTGFSAQAVQALLNHDYPGNIRELQNLVERGVIAAPGNAAIRPQHLFPSGEQAPPGGWGINGDGSLDGNETQAQRSPLVQLKQSIHARQLAHYRQVVQACAGNLSAAARQLGVTRPQLAYRLKAGDLQDD
ncbi:sigma-54-dependent Fis family transcriptional regulator [Pseudomonas eucalypticola]|uniref:Sigma 54-interacting transcriptional regulator n=1 Tax=Pseudomonas eucalypticola TaxID=2599595 RepID=A0A7D5D8H5_9PSED|nr:sigma-54-dependent Fis family transcriptional regulator [Pseudomonas eucalypticola]QKZ04755.1 sigma 54-interacting transcriptional regulator [Pseudomonas eucalypticola]